MNTLPVTGAHIPPQPVRLLIYAHFDPENVIQGYVLDALRSMSKVCHEIRFVSTSALPDSELAKIRPYARETLKVENIGFDFHMWKCALQTVILEDYDELVLMNSSVYGPLSDISPIFAAMQAKLCDCWGITESYEHDRHLQSYFIVFRKSVLSSEAFRLFWNSVLPYRNKFQVIRSYEIGLSQWLLGHGFRLLAYISWKQVVRYLAAHPLRAQVIYGNLTRALRLCYQTIHFILRNLHRQYIRPINPTVAYPEELIILGVPFLKLEVVRDNPFMRNLSGIINALNALNYQQEYLLTKRPPVGPVGIATSYSAICPLCGQDGDNCYTGLSDNFGVNNPGVWNIRQCRSRDCGCTWLDPAPYESELSKVYGTYYTHQGVTESLEYYPPDYGSVARILLKTALRCLHYLRINPQRESFWLHGLEKGQGRLLELGCGEGSRLAALKERGWTVEGQEIDPKAVSNCRSKGLVIHEGKIEQVGLPEKSFDIILISHVIEHVHRPEEFLKHCRKLLRPGGRLILSTPNIESLGHRIYGRYWLALDVPRHLILHNRRSLYDVLHRAGFGRISVKTVALNCELTSMHSRDIKYFGWTDMNSMPRIGKELIPVLLQLAALILQLFLPGWGEECFAVAENAQSVPRQLSINSAQESDN